MQCYEYSACINRMVSNLPDDYSIREFDIYSNNKQNIEKQKV